MNEVFLKIIDDHITYDPMNEKFRWTNLTTKKARQWIIIHCRAIKNPGGMGF